MSDLTVSVSMTYVSESNSNPIFNFSLRFALSFVLACVLLFLRCGDGYAEKGTMSDSSDCKKGHLIRDAHYRYSDLVS